MPSLQVSEHHWFFAGSVILTPAAEKFVTPLTFQSVTGRKAFSEADLWGGQAHVLHVGLGHNADLMVIAPCTANTLGKLAHGIADNLLTITALAARCPLLVAPAMDTDRRTWILGTAAVGGRER